MDAYKILNLVGEGSFGRVFKAKTRDTKQIVALKIIRKCGRTHKELKSLRSECEIQKNLHHRNIIQMINSFETDNEIVVVTEFCKRDLHYILAKQTYLAEEEALPIVCDLVSALYYLHSNRVLHRDLKPQNVLITNEGVAKLCDFGFARSMSRGTHVLTSIKGTPLYMAPELIEESPYDHNADLWSLGCIVYEMMVGVPPFTTTSILQLVRMIRSDPVTWPSFLSPACQDLLQGLLQKDPGSRLSWPHLLHHPFLQGKVSDSINSGASLPLTKELTSSQALAKESQKLDLASKMNTQIQGLPQKIQQILDKEKKVLKEGGCQTETACEGGRGTVGIDLNTLEQKLTQLKMVAASDIELTAEPVEDKGQDSSTETDSESGDGDASESSGPRVPTPLETEEWLAFLQTSLQEVMRGDVESICQRSFVTMVTKALTQHGAAPRISEYIACLLSLPYVAPGVSKSELATIAQVYMDVKVVSSALFAIKLLTSRPGCSASHDSLVEPAKLTSAPAHLLAIERLLSLLCQLIHSDQMFLSQLCDATALLHLPPRFHLLLTLYRIKPRITADLVAILTHILREMPENAVIVDETLISESSSGFNWVRMMMFSNKSLQTRVCLLIQLLARHCVSTLHSMWGSELRSYMEDLAYDSSQDLRCAAEDVIEITQLLPFYNQEKPGSFEYSNIKSSNK